jgi:hypothetical protein
MSQETILVMTARMDDGLRQLVTEACEHARVRPVFWDGATPQGGVENPSLLIAALVPGERTIPQDVAFLVTRTFRSLPLLLLSPEPLVRNSVSLQGGRVTLLGHPLSREKISGRIRTALVGHAESGFYPLVGDGRSSPTVRVREFRGREWWVAAIARGPANGAGDDLFPSVRKLGPHGFAGLLPLDFAQPLAHATLDQAAEALVAALPSDQALTAVADKVGNQAAGVWFAPSNSRWSFYCPQPDLTYWLLSPTRLPPRSRMNGASGAAWRHLPASSGDLILICALSPSVRSVIDLDATSGELWKVADGGGPAVLDHLESRFNHTDAPCAALIVELR